MTADVDAAWAAEELLLGPDSRRNAGLLDRMLDPGFHEIGQSGRHWSRVETLAAMAAEEPVDNPARFVIDERRADVLADGLVLLSFRVDYAGRTSRRSSIWRVGLDGPRLLFQQGTPVGP